MDEATMRAFLVVNAPPPPDWFRHLQWEETEKIWVEDHSQPWTNYQRLAEFRHRRHESDLNRECRWRLQFADRMTGYLSGGRVEEVAR